MFYFSSDDDVCFDVKLTTVRFGSEISWNLKPSITAIKEPSCQSNGGYGNNAEYTEQCCLEPGEYIFVCKDSHGDGWHGAYIEVNGEKYCESYNYGTINYSRQIIIKSNGKYFEKFLMGIFVA